jgi:hypothetical protein
MAKQIGIFPLSGSLDNITFFRTPEGGYRVRKKTSLNSERMLKMPAFDRTREHNAEFATAARAMKTIRSSVKGHLRNTADRKSALRLRHLLTDCLHADTNSIRGQRSPQNGDLSLLKNFDFNNRALLHTVFAAPFTTTIDRRTGTLSLTIPAFNPKLLLTAPPQATHFRILMAGAAVDFATEATESSTTESAILPLTLTSAINLTVALTPNTTGHLLTFLSIHFYEETAGVKYPIHTANPLTIVEVDQKANTLLAERDGAITQSAVAEKSYLAKTPNH